MVCSCVADAPDPQRESWEPSPAQATNDNQATSQTATSTENADVFQVKFETSKGDFTVEVQPDWAPRGAERFRELVEAKFFDEARFFRVIEGFMVQFGIHADPEVSSKWRTKTIQDDPVQESNARGMITFATSGPNSRTTQVFINFGDNTFLDSQGFSPFGKVIEGMEVVDSLYNEYGEGAPSGRGPDQGRIQREGNAYLTSEFPELDYVKTARIIE
jgi:peptidyl-prolyl cis-trans isomerase A (cyclophilin A)